jgi:CRISPR-associated protein Cas5d
MKVERVSYDVMTPSAARGILEAILWKPSIRWIVEQIDVLAPIRWESVRRNEIGCVMSHRTNGIFVDEERQQRAGLFLRDVAYTVHARFELTDKAGPEDNVIKFQEMFDRRASKGQVFHRPYLGCREFAADFTPVLSDALPAPIADSRDLGYMLMDVIHDHNGGENFHPHHCGPKCLPKFFHANLEVGRLRVPPVDGPEVQS